jgi:signal peptidase II
MPVPVLIWVALLAFAVDQVSKMLVIFGMDLKTRLSIDVLPPLLNFRYGENRGINFGILDGGGEAQRWLLIGFSLAVILALVVWIRRTDAPRGMQVAAGLLIGGAAGNVLDRLIHGFVLDFLNMSCCGIANPFVFNIADVFIFAGALLLVVLDARREPENAP